MNRKVYLTAHEHKKIVDILTGKKPQIPRTAYTVTKLPKWRYDGLRKVADGRGVSFSRALTEAVDLYLAAYGITKPQQIDRAHIRIEVERPRKMKRDGILGAIFRAFNGED